MAEEKQKTQRQLPAAVQEAIYAGGVVFYGEFRRGAAVEFGGKGGRLFHQTKCVVETENGVITVTEFLPDGADWKSWVPPFTKGQMVLGVCRSLEEASGAVIASAKLVAVT